MKDKLNLIWDDFLSELGKSISIPSILNEDSSKYPFGEEIQRVLEETISLAEKLGFKTYTDPEGYYGYAEIGQGEELVGVLGHLDVVPTGDLSKWNTDPFKLEMIEDKFYGRGTKDDKGPLLAALYSAHLLIKEGHEFNRRLRFIFGTDEENLWRGISKYLEKEEVPSISFTPDSGFPVVYAEKGLVQYSLEGINESNISMAGGDALNSTPSKMVYSGEKLEEIMSELDALNFEYIKEGDSLEVKGKSVHTKIAPEGINAISRLIMGMKNCGFQSKIINFVGDLIGEDAHGTKIFNGLEDEPTGKLTFNIGKISMDETTEKLGVDIRFPVVDTDKEDIFKLLNEKAKDYGLEVKEIDYLRPVYMPLDCELIKTLLETYQEKTGDYTTKPVASGGATYARAMENCVAFGPAFPDSISTEHKPNEFITLKELKLSMEIYYDTIKKLTGKGE